MRRWKLGVGVALAAVLVFLAIGLVGKKAQGSPSARGQSSAPSFARLRDGAAGVPARPPDWSADFSGSRLDTSAWSTCYPWMNSPAGCTNFGNTEYQWFLPSQVQVRGGVLRLIAQRVPTEGKAQDGSPRQYDCRSGMVTTFKSYRFQYGYVQVVAKIPERPGLWPGIWLAAADLSWPPEIDLVESWGVHALAGAYFHPVGGGQVVNRFHSPLSDGWNTFGLSWTKSQLTWYVDGRVVLTVRSRIPHQPMYFIADLAEYLHPTAKADCNGQLAIRSVKIWTN